MKNYEGFIKVWHPGKELPIKFEGRVNLIVDPAGDDDTLTFEFRANIPDAKVTIVSVPTYKFMVQYYEDNELSGEDDIIDCDPDDWSDVLDLKA